MAVQEIGDPAALDDLIALLHGTWQAELSTHPDGRGIRVGWPQAPPELRTALTTITQHVDDYIDHARLPRAA